MSNSIHDYGIDPEALLAIETMDKLLSDLVAVYASYNVPLPTRRYWGIGDPVWDCDQAVISFMQIYLGAPGDEASTPTNCDGPKSLVVNISVVRKMVETKTGKPPGPDVIQKDAAWSVLDAYIIMESLKHFGDPSYPVGMIATASVPPPSGGYQGVVVTLTLPLI